MNKNIVKIIPVFAPEFCDDGPKYARVEITPDLLKRIRQLAEVVKGLKIYMIEEFDYTPAWCSDEKGKEEWDGRTECGTLQVMDTSFRWAAIVKHTDITLTTEEVYIKEFK